MTVLATIDAEGFTVVRAGEPDALRREAEASPYALATRILGVAPLLVERQRIRPVDEGRSFASTRIDTPIHTDSQMLLGVPASVQILVCLAPAARGGESVLVDGHRVLALAAAEAPRLFTALHDVPRVQRFYFGDVEGPTVALRGGHHTWTYSPVTSRLRGDAVGKELDELVARRAAELERVFVIGRGDALVASNHRMLHGRRPFEGERDLVRLLVWLEAPFRAARGPARMVVPARTAESSLRLRTVFALLRGGSPSRIAADAGIDEAMLYAWRDAFVRGGLEALR